jgi:fibronectin-binding autotransporter adhesin
VKLHPLPLSRLSLCLASLAIPPLVTASHGASLYWDGTSTGPDADGGAGTWSTDAPANWDTSASGGSDVAWTTGSDAVFGGTGGTVTVSGTVSATSLAFTAPGYSSSGGAITLTGTPVIDVAAHDVTLGSVLSGSTAISKTGTGTLTLSGANTFTGALTVSTGILRTGSSKALGTTGTMSGTVISPGATLDINGQSLGAERITISGSGVDGAGAIVNTGTANSYALQHVTLAGPATVGGTARWDIRTLSGVGAFQMGGHTLAKTGTNTFHLVHTAVTAPGHIDVQQGSFWVETSSTLAGSAANTITIRSGAALTQWQNNQDQKWTAVFENDASWIALQGLSRWAGPASLSGATTFDVGGHEWGEASMTNTGVISGSGSMTKIGPGTWTLSALNTYTGGTTVNAGTLVLNAAGGGVGTLRGVLTVNAGGTLSVPVANALGTTEGSCVSTLNISGGLVELTGNASNGVPVLNFSSGMLRSNGGVADPAATSYHVMADDAVIHSLPAQAPAIISGRLHLATGNSGNVSEFHVETGIASEDLRIDAAITEAAAGQGIAKHGSGLMVLSGPSLFSGDTTVEEGTLLLGKDGTLTDSAVFVEDGARFGTSVAGKTLGSLTANGGSSLILPARAGGTTTVTGTLALAGGSIGIFPVLGANDLAGTYDLLMADSITGSGTPVLDWAGAYGPSRASGTVAVNGNKLQLVLTGTGADLVWDNASAGGAANGTWNNTLANFSGGAGNEVFQAFDSVTFDDTAAPGSAKTIALEGLLAPARLTVDNSEGDIVFNSTGGLVGAGSLVKTGSGKLTLAGSNSYAMGGHITAGGGVLDFGQKTISAAGLTLSGIGQFNNATAIFGAIDLQHGTSNATLLGSVPWTKTTNATVTLTGASELSGPGTIAEGDLIVGNLQTPDMTATPGKGPISIAAPATLTYCRGDASLTIPNSFSGSGGLTLVGQQDISLALSSFKLAGDNSGFSGQVTADDVQLFVLPAHGAGSGPIVLTGRAKLLTQKVTMPNAITVSPSGLASNGSPVWGNLTVHDATLSGPITLTGATTTSLRSAGLGGSRSVVSGPIGESGGPASLALGSTYSGNTITLSGASTYTGFTTISGSFTANLTGSLGATAVTVGGFATIGGNGTIGSGGSLTFQNQAVLKADMSGSALTVNGDVNLGPSTKLALEATTTLPGGPIPVLQYTGTLTGGTANLSMDYAPNYRQAVFAFSPGLITVDIGSKALFWRSGTTWDSGTSKCWGTGSGSGSPTQFFYRGDSVVFDDNGSGGYIGGPGGSFTAQPSSMVVNNSTKDYNIGTSISGPCAVTKNGAGLLRMAGYSSYTGGTFIHAGRLEAVASGAPSPLGSALGTGPVSVAAGATLAGDAYIPGTVTVHGTVNPSPTGGYTVGTLITGPMVITGNYSCELDENGSDRIEVTGDLDLQGSTLSLEKTFIGTDNPAKFVIASYTGNLTGSFSSVSGMPADHVLKYDSAAKQIIVARVSLADWAAGFPGLGDVSPAGDPDGDGIANLLEYVFGGNPGAADPAILPQPSLDEFYYYFRYLRSDASYHHTVQTVQWSTDLDNWTDIPVGENNNGTVMIDREGDAPDEITVRVERSAVGDAPVFMRLRVVEK